KFTETDIKSRLREMLCGKRIAIAAAGNIQAHVVHEFAEQAFGHLVEGDAHMPAVPKSSSGLVIAPLSVSQCYLNLGVSWPGVRDGDYIAAVVATAILGGGMSSRLFQVLREERGLTYDVGAQSFCYPDTGALVISAICERRNLDIVLELILEQMATLEHDGVREDELGRVIEMLVSQVEMEADSVGARMWRLVETELDFGRYVSVDETITRLRRLRREKVAEVIRCWFSQTECVLVLGGDVDDYRPSELVAMKTRAVIGK
ncbi:MAG: insulinase family protein, partial [Deltaproteobacteria bacterium]|nr:insulinase family protein [Deltaproteobacteria bacterium]